MRRHQRPVSSSLSRCSFLPRGSWVVTSSPEPHGAELGGRLRDWPSLTPHSVFIQQTDGVTQWVWDIAGAR